MDKPVWDNDCTYHGAMTVKVSCHPSVHGARAFCNILGDEPLFYIDDAAADEESDLLFMEDMEMFPADEKFLTAMREKMNAYEKTADTLSKVDLKTQEEAFDSVFMTSSQKSPSMDDVIAYGQKSGIFKSYMKFMKDKDISVLHDASVKTAFYNRHTKSVLLNPSLSMEQATQSLMRAMRTAWQHLNGALLNPLLFQPEESVLMNRLMAADADVAVVAYLWDMKLAGEEQLWSTAMSGADYDLCTAYAMEAMTDFRSIKSGLAPRAAFEKWFMSGRCKSHDRDIIQIMMGGHTDIDINDEDMSRMIAMDMIAAMGKRPTGRNYLSALTTNIMNDPIFGEVRDRSNANFLWFVTFERRMANMEQELQDKDFEHKEKDNVLKLPEIKPMSDKDAIENNVASVFFLDHFRAG